MPHTLENKTLNFIRQHQLINPGEKVLAAVSGGVDSMVMLHFLHRQREIMEIELAVAHFNHKLRAQESERDEKFVRRLADKLKLPFHAGKWERKEDLTPGSLQMKARKARFIYFDSIIQQRNYHKLALAHNKNDHLETILIALLKGYGFKGIAGILPQSGGRIHPFLNITRSEILSYAKKHDLRWVEDSSNYNTYYLRNYMRMEIIPRLQTAIPQFDSSLLSLAQTCFQIDSTLTSSTETLWENGSVRWEKDRIILDIVEFLTYLNVIQNYILIDICAKLNSDFHPSTGIIENIKKLCGGNTGSFIKIGHIEIVKDRNKLIFARQAQAQHHLIVDLNETYQIDGITLKTETVNVDSVEFNSNPEVEFADLDNIQGSLTFRNWRKGDRFHPLGMEHSMKVSDFLINQKISRIDKNQTFVLCDDHKIVWLCGLRLDDRVKIKKNTTRAVRFTFRPNI